MVHRRLVYIYLLNVPSFSSRYFNKITRTSRIGRLLALSLEILHLLISKTYNSHFSLCSLNFRIGNHYFFYPHYILCIKSLNFRQKKSLNIIFFIWGVGGGSKLANQYQIQSTVFTMTLFVPKYKIDIKLNFCYNEF